LQFCNSFMPRSTICFRKEGFREQGSDGRRRRLCRFDQIDGFRMQRKILIMGLPGAGKTTLTRVLAPMLNAVVFNADEVRTNINRDLGFALEDRIEHARRMGWLCDRVAEAGTTAIADFICPTPETRAVFGPAFVIWVNRIAAGRFEDTNRLFVPPETCDLRVDAEGTPQAWAERIRGMLRPVTASKQRAHVAPVAAGASPAGMRTSLETA
jgi:hypothetical protein